MTARRATRSSSSRSPTGRSCVESDGGADPAPFAAALGESIAPPYRALAVRRPEVWAVGAVAIEVGRLEPDPRGDELELTWNGSELELTIDDLPAEPSRAAALERLAAERVDGAVRRPRAPPARRSLGALRPRALGGSRRYAPLRRARSAIVARSAAATSGRFALEPPDLPVEDRDERHVGSSATTDAVRRPPDSTAISPKHVARPERAYDGSVVHRRRPCRM